MPILVLRVVAFLACAAPGIELGWRTVAGDLGVNPVETLLHTTGRTALAILIVTLAITPIRRLTGWNPIQRVRRMVGNWSFFYALAHFLIYAVFNHLGDVNAIWTDITERPFILSGMVAFAILTVLAATSPTFMVASLGRRWQTLHRLVYLAVGAGVLHFAWGQKADIREPLLWGAVAAVLLLSRLVLRKRKAAPAGQPLRSV
jgi:sulfoxide reductase heme-binding subunit YedZ